VSCRCWEGGANHALTWARDPASTRQLDGGDRAPLGRRRRAGGVMRRPGSVPAVAPRGRPPRRSGAGPSNVVPPGPRFQACLPVDVTTSMTTSGSYAASRPDFGTRGRTRARQAEPVGGSRSRRAEPAPAGSPHWFRCPSCRPRHPHGMDSGNGPQRTAGTPTRPLSPDQHVDYQRKQSVGTAGTEETASRVAVRILIVTASTCDLNSVRLIASVSPVAYNLGRMG
jgi:hypothetical protein